jgi:hypothetical protein
MTIVKKRVNNQWRFISGAPTNIPQPDPPSIILAMSPTAGSLYVSWSIPPSQGSSAIVHYKVIIRVNGSSTIVSNTNTGAYDVDFIVSGLTNGTAYRAYVVATNSNGDSVESDPSAVVTVTTATTYTLPSGAVIPAGWANPKTTGLVGASWGYGSLTPYVGNITTTNPNQIIEGLDIQGIVIVLHDGVRVQHCRLRSVQTSATQIVGETVVDSSASVVVNGNPVYIATNLTVSYCDIYGSSDSNLTDQTAVGGGIPAGTTVDHCMIRGAVNGIRPGSSATVTNNCVYDMKAPSGSQADCVQVLGGAGALIQDNTLISLLPGVAPVAGGDGVARLPQTGSVGNSALQVGVQSTALTTLNVHHNYLSGGMYTVNSINTGEATYGNITGSYTNNVFSGYFHYGPVGNLGTGMTFDNTNVWEATRETDSWYGTNDANEKFWRLTGGSQVNGTTTSTTP